MAGCKKKTHNQTIGTKENEISKPNTMTYEQQTAMVSGGGTGGEGKKQPSEKRKKISTTTMRKLRIRNPTE